MWKSFFEWLKLEYAARLFGVFKAVGMLVRALGYVGMASWSV